MSKLVKCAGCGLQVDKNEAIRYKDKNFHKKCYEIQKDKDEIFKYVCELFGLKKPGPVIYSQLKRFMEKYPHYTYKGILNSLVYFYDVKHSSKKKSNEAIGIVPYVYDEAQEYFNTVEKKKIAIANKIEKQLEVKPEIKIIKKDNEVKKMKIYNLEDFLED
jgi:SPBc2 prophage-derived uncharacterized protein yorH